MSFYIFLISFIVSKQNNVPSCLRNKPRSLNVESLLKMRRRIYDRFLAQHERVFVFECNSI